MTKDSRSQYSKAQQSNGVNNHLRGSRMNESACSSPLHIGRSERARMPDPP
jgi:hypothetical protein